jgi:hypothetical protein
LPIGTVGQRGVIVSDIRCDAWEAVHERVPGKDNALTVTGVCHAPQPGWSFALRRVEAEGGDPRELRLRLEAEGPQEAPAQRSDVAVEFVTFIDDDIDRVTIEGIAGPIPVDVLT